MSVFIALHLTFIFISSYVFGMCIYVHECRCLWGPKEGNRYPGARVTGGSEEPNVALGTQPQSSAKAASAPNIYAVSLHPPLYFLRQGISQNLELSV